MPPPVSPVNIVDPSQLMTEEDIINERCNFASLLDSLYGPLMTVKWCAKHRLIPNSHMCEGCNVLCGLVNHSAESTDPDDGMVWCCELCKEHTSVRKGSWFERSSLKWQNIMIIIYHWAMPFDLDRISYEGDINMDTAKEWCASCRRVCQEYLEKYPIEIGGIDPLDEQKVVEIDETVFESGDCKKLVFGGVERRTKGKKCFLLEVPDKTEGTLRAATCKYVLPGSHVVTDNYEAYNNINQWAGGIYSHDAMSNNWRNLDRYDKDIHIQNMKSMWSRLKEDFECRHHGDLENLSSYLQEFVWRSSLSNKHYAFGHFLAALQSLYGFP